MHADPGVARSLTVRAVVALSMLVGFSGIAVAVGGGLVALPFVVFAATGSLILKLAIVCVIAGGTILWSLVPRFQRWVPPGPLLDETKEPRLFATIREIAETMKQ